MRRNHNGGRLEWLHPRTDCPHGGLAASPFREGIQTKAVIGSEMFKPRISARIDLRITATVQT